jgi:hypothetical protein
LKKKKSIKRRRERCKRGLWLSKIMVVIGFEDRIVENKEKVEK